MKIKLKNKKIIIIFIIIRLLKIYIRMQKMKKINFMINLKNKIIIMNLIETKIHKIKNFKIRIKIIN
jgi:hypothetical protein